ncbi:MAG: 16S rRNA (guanine(527)-N(7))-methyltransferase RsmG [Anaerolineales bacterium]|nr:16S rRNA (guanine(527)-N(7))-methyltransferase RsmG [Anaerolineales bacterium]
MEHLINGAKALLGLELTRDQIAAFQTYTDELRAWNARFNLTAITDDADIQVKHFLDSLSLLPLLRPGAPGRLIDVGAGAGFPGLPLKIMRPELAVTLVEATGKKAKFCEAVAARLGLTGVTVVNARAEDVGQDPAHRERYDWAVARAVAALPVLAEYLLPLVKIGGQAVAQKGANAPHEAQAAAAAVSLLGGGPAQLRPVALPGVAEARYVVVYPKLATTPRAYPRRVGVPAKSPLK